MAFAKLRLLSGRTCLSYVLTSGQLRQWVPYQNNKLSDIMTKQLEHSVDISCVGTPFHSNSGDTPRHETIKEK